MIIQSIFKYQKLHVIIIEQLKLIIIVHISFQI